MEQLHKIFSVLGTPDETSWPGISGSGYACYRDNFPQVSAAVIQCGPETYLAWLDA